MLSSRPTEAERGLPHVVLTDLLEDVVEDVLPAMSAPPRRALEIALLMGRPPEYPLDPRAPAVAVRTALEVLAEERPLVLAVDDSHWVDDSSAAAPGFALRRIRGEHVLGVRRGVSTSTQRRVPDARPVGLDPDQLRAGDQHPPVEEPVGRPTESFGAFSGDVAVAVEVDGDDLPRPRVREPQPAVVPARRLGHRQSVEQYARRMRLLRRVVPIQTRRVAKADRSAPASAFGR